ncbi:hypothetical protein SODG_002798 [Sodalis praecaptivus]
MGAEPGVFLLADGHHYRAGRRDIIAVGRLPDLEGRGKSFIDWSKWAPEIEQAKKAFAWIGDKITGLVNDVGGWQNTLNILATFIAGAWVSKVLGAFGKIAGLPIPPWLKLWGLYAGYLVSDREKHCHQRQSVLGLQHPADKAWCGR